MIDVSFTDFEEPVHINLIDKEQIDWAIKEGFKYAHLCTIKLGLRPLVHPYLPISSLCVVIDTRHRNFADAIIGGFTAPLHDGPAFGTVFPKYSVNVLLSVGSDELRPLKPIYLFVRVCNC